MKKNKRKSGYIGNRTNEIQSISWAVLQIVSVLGWPGACVVLSILAINKWASLEQKKSIIDKYILFNWNGNYWCVFIPVLAVIMIFLSQHYFHKKKILLKDEEIIRITNERNRLQEKLSQKSFHTSQGV
jgi:hypothetical protein